MGWLLFILLIVAAFAAWRFLKAPYTGRAEEDSLPIEGHVWQPDHRQRDRFRPEPETPGAFVRPVAQQGAQQFSGEQLPPAALELKRASSLFSLACVVSPSRVEPVEVADLGHSDVPYVVDLQAQTCNCPRFQSRASHPRNHFGRWCKHLVIALRDDGAFDGAEEWHQAIAQADHGGPVAAFWLKLSSSPPVLVAIGDTPEWVNIYARTARSRERISEASGPIERFGWSVQGHRWAWGIAPPGAREIRRLLRSVVEVSALDRKPSDSRTSDIDFEIVPPARRR